MPYMYSMKAQKYRSQSSNLGYESVWVWDFCMSCAPEALASSVNTRGLVRGYEKPRSPVQDVRLKNRSLDDMSELGP